MMEFKWMMIHTKQLIQKLRPKCELTDLMLEL
jgi:hypothetical protein